MFTLSFFLSAVAAPSMLEILMDEVMEVWCNKLRNKDLSAAGQSGRVVNGVWI